MRALLDTSVFLWLVNEPDRLNPKARSILSSPASQLYLSSASCWEIVIKERSGKLRLEMPAPQYIQSWQAAYRVESLAVLQSHVFALHDLPEVPSHKDPFDRMLIAQATAEGMVLLTSDRALDKYPVKKIWSGR